MGVLIRVATGLLIVISGALIVHSCPNGTLFMLLTVHLCSLVVVMTLGRFRKMGASLPYYTAAATFKSHTYLLRRTEIVKICIKVDHYVANEAAIDCFVSRSLYMLDIYIYVYTTHFLLDF